MFSNVSCYDLKDTFTRNQPQHRRAARGSPHPDTAQARQHGRGYQEEEQQLLAEGELVELERSLCEGSQRFHNHGEGPYEL